jgi:hypothetical protein
MMNEVRNIAAVGLSVLILTGCAERSTPTRRATVKPVSSKPAPARPAPARPVAAKPVAARPVAAKPLDVQPTEKPAEPAAKSVAGNIAYGRVLALSFTDDLANTVPSSLSVRPAGDPSIVDAGKFGSGCRLEKGATLSVPALPMTAEGTWGLWIRPDAKQVASEARVLDANAFGFFLRGARITAAFHDGQSIGLQGPDIPSEEWTHLAMTWGKESLKLYINGELHGQRVIKGAPGFPKRKLFIGSRWTGSTLTFTGVVDDVVIYRRAIEAEEVKYLVAQGLK